MTVMSPMTLQPQASRQPSANSSAVRWAVGRALTSPFRSLTRHLPQEPLPEQGASMATLALRATSRSFSPTVAEMETGVPVSKVKVMFGILLVPFREDFRLS